jgi:hypothetical protein
VVGDLLHARYFVVVVVVVKLNVPCERNTNDDYDAVTFETRWSMGIHAY